MNLGLPLIIIVIFLIVWIVSNVLRAQQDAAQAAARRASRPVGASPPLPTASGRGNSDIDRFLQEIDRLRRKGQPDQPEGRPSPATTTTTSTTAESPPPPRPKPVAQSKKPIGEREKRKPVVRRPTPPSQPRSAPPPPLPAVPGTVAEPSSPRPEQAVPPPSAPTAPSFRIVTPAKPSEAGRSATAAAQALQSLLKSSQGPAVAFLLMEIMGKPKCRQ